MPAFRKVRAAAEVFNVYFWAAEFKGLVGQAVSPVFPDSGNL
jgi:hypothetical protein